MNGNIFHVNLFQWNMKQKVFVSENCQTFDKNHHWNELVFFCLRRFYVVFLVCVFFVLYICADIWLKQITLMRCIDSAQRDDRRLSFTRILKEEETTEEKTQNLDTYSEVNYNDRNIWTSITFP